ncbi:DUF924 family protein [Maritalea mediterranea]|uniref:DUF924 domain-containing protein n=1 Tax=Maritalea mediterranea TaxID=2909667 RepID=A0ABS9E988_9HYPH|nr:DUF924 family protein [Maritalea mediterranea]MCF4099454.1 DUF924 domain-containing protein [Maritalea mediterranea]
MTVTAKDIIDFWFVEHGEKDWFMGGEEFDAKIIDRFKDTHTAAARGDLFDWRNDAEGRLAEIIILDQFSRQIYRKDKRAFASDMQALTLAQEMVARGDDQTLDNRMRVFAYMPYMHAESLKVHDEALKLFKSLGNEDSLNYEIKHRDIIEQFGRYPYRNQVLGRKNTPAEEEFLAGEFDSFGQ